MTFLKLFFMKDLHNGPAYLSLCELNKSTMAELNDDLQEKVGYQINEDVLKEISVHLLLCTHDTSEILEILQEFHQLK